MIVLGSYDTCMTQNIKNSDNDNKS
jgi:hypothetical protein